MIKYGGIPVFVASEELMWQCLQLLISRRTHLDVAQALIDVDWDDESVGSDETLRSASLDGPVINLASIRLHL